MNYTQSLSLLIIATIVFPNHSPINKPFQGVIAYMRDEKEIRLIQPDGSGDHQLWTHKDAQPYSGIGDLAWSPDGKNLAFSSGHASATSLFCRVSGEGTWVKKKTTTMMIKTSETKTPHKISVGTEDKNLNLKS